MKNNKIYRFLKRYLYQLSLKYHTNKWNFSKKGYNVVVQKGAIIAYDSMIEIGDNVNIGPNSVLFAIYKKLKIGNNVLIAPNVTMVTGDHGIYKIGIPIIKNEEKRPGEDKEITIEDDVWIGANATILKGVIIGRGAVVAAGAVVIKDVLPYTIVGGYLLKLLVKDSLMKMQ